MDKQCYFCEEPNYALLDCHRIKPGKDGGRYTHYNTLTICSNCHRKCHTGDIVILGKHLSTNGLFVVHYLENGVEKWK